MPEHNPKNERLEHNPGEQMQRADEQEQECKARTRRELREESPLEVRSQQDRGLEDEAARHTPRGDQAQRG